MALCGESAELNVKTLMLNSYDFWAFVIGKRWWVMEVVLWDKEVCWPLGYFNDISRDLLIYEAVSYSCSALAIHHS